MSNRIFTGHCVVDSEGDIKYIAIDGTTGTQQHNSLTCCEMVRNREHLECNVATYREVASSLEGVPNVYNYQVLENL